MQSFKYSVPPPPEDRDAARRRFKARAIAVAAVIGLAAGGTGLAVSPVPGAIAGSFGWLVGHPAAADEKDRQASALLREGEDHLKAGAFAPAIAAFDAALALRPEGLEAYWRGRHARYLAGATTTPAIAELLAQSRQRSAFYMALGDAEAAAKRWGPALLAYSSAVAESPRDAAAHRGRARALAAKGRLEEALEAYAEARRLAPDDHALVTAEVALRYQAGQSEAGARQAEAYFAPKARESEASSVHVPLLEALIRQGLSPEAIRARTLAVAPKMAPDRQKLYLAEAYLNHYRTNPNWHQGSFAHAVANSKAAMASKDALVRTAAGRLLALAHAERADRFFARSDFAAARSELARVLKLKGHLKNDRRRLADMLVLEGHLAALQGKASELVRCQEAALAVDPGHPCRSELVKSHANVAVGFMSVRKSREALKPLTRAVALAPHDPELLARLYQAHQRTRNREPLKAVSKAAGLGDIGEAYTRVYHGLYKLGARRDADALVAAAVRAKLSPERLAALKAEQAAARGQRSEARQALAVAVGRQPTRAGWLELAELDLALAAHDAKQRATHRAHAREALRHALALGGDAGARDRLTRLHQALAEQALADKKPAEAEAIAAAGLLLDPHHPWLALALGIAQIERGAHEAAQANLSAGLVGVQAPTHPAHALLRERLAEVYVARGQFEQAIAEYKQGLAQEVAAEPKRCAALYYGLAFALAKHGAREEALNATRQYIFWSLHDPLQGARVDAIQELELQLTSDAQRS